MPAVCSVRSPILDEEILAERTQGIEAGLAWRAVADATVVYEDCGI